MKRLLIFLFAVAVFAGCSKMEEKKETGTQTQNGDMQMPPDMTDPHKKTEGTDPHSSGIDSATIKVSQDAMEFEKTYEKNKSEENKQELIKKHLAAGDAFSPEGNMEHMSKESFRTSLKHYRRVLELDPTNQAAIQGRGMIESMYQQIGLPIPE